MSIFARKVIGKAHTDFPTQTGFAEESIPYFGPEENFQKFETVNGSDNNWKHFLGRILCKNISKS